MTVRWEMSMTQVAQMSRVTTTFFLLSHYIGSTIDQRSSRSRALDPLVTFVAGFDGYSWPSCDQLRSVVFPKATDTFRTYLCAAGHVLICRYFSFLQRWFAASFSWHQRS